MSSHHVIRDEQEPPVFVFTDTFHLETLKELLGWSPLLYVDINLAQWFDALQLKVDAYIAITKVDVEKYETPFIRIDTHEDKNLYLHVISDVIGDRKFTAINLFCTDNQRISILQNLSQLDSKFYPLRLFVGEEKTILTNSGMLKKWFPKGQKIKLDISTITEPSVQHTDGFSIIEEEGIYTLKSELGKIIFTEY